MNNEQQHAFSYRTVTTLCQVMSGGSQLEQLGHVMDV
jgi:hypothetical protein